MDMILKKLIITKGNCMIKKYIHLKIGLALLILTCVPLVCLFAQIQSLEYPPKPKEREFISDMAGLLPASDADAIRSSLDKLLTEKAIPIIIVTIESLAKYNASGMRIEMYARMLFDAWGIGHEKIKMKGRGMGRTSELSWNKGILLLVSLSDRKVRIELGADFGREKDMLCSDIMQTHIVPYFKRDDYAGGIKAGVTALEQMARGEEIKSPPRPLWHYVLAAVAVGLAIFTFTSLIKRGSSGWAWLFWGIAFSIIGMMLFRMLMSRGGSGGFGGGSFGGGFSGGGGASGSW